MLKKNSTKPVFISRSSFHKVQLRYYDSKAHKYTKFNVFDRNSTIVKSLVKKKLFVRVGAGWRIVRVNKWMVGFKIGAFTWTRKFWQKRLKRRPTKPKKR